jgi:tetratricopeptide (TPR) repeat protein
MKAKLTGQSNVETLNDLGVWFGEHESYDCAAEVFATSLQMDPAQKDLSHVAFLFGASLYFSGNVSEGVAALREAEKLGYRHIRLHTVLAEALEKQKDLDGAIAEWRLALEFEPEATELIDPLSRDLLAAAKYEEEINLLESPRVKPQRTPIQFLGLAAAYEKMGRPQNAAETLAEAMNTYPEAAEVAQQLARVLDGLGRGDESARVRKLLEARTAGR